MKVNRIKVEMYILIYLDERLSLLTKKTKLSTVH